MRKTQVAVAAVISLTFLSQGAVRGQYAPQANPAPQVWGVYTGTGPGAYFSSSPMGAPNSISSYHGHPVGQNLGWVQGGGTPGSFAAGGMNTGAMANAAPAGNNNLSMPNIGVPVNMVPYVGAHFSSEASAPGPELHFANTVRDSVQNRLLTHDTAAFTPDWYKAHPHAWHGGFNLPAEFNAWNTAKWSDVAKTLGIGADPIDFDFAFDNYGYPQVYENGEPTGAVTKLRDAAQQLADRDDPIPADTQWLPLGVFVLIPPSQSETQMIVHLSLNKDGVVRGSYFDPLADASQGVRGEVDKQTQLVAWKIGTQKSVIFETGLCSLTKGQATAVAHFNDGWTHIWSIVRMKQKPTPKPTKPEDASLKQPVPPPPQPVPPQMP
jgi:hypothetical protein